jgi:hypothetical protein
MGSPSAGQFMTRLLVTLHRWIGIVLCLMFATWFASGVVMIYVPFPSLSEADRIAGADELAVSEVGSLPAALAATGIDSVDRLRLLQYQLRPMLVVEGDGGIVTASFADTAQRITPMTDADARNIAERFSGVAVASVSDLISYDQWVVHHRFDPYRPFFRVELADSAQTHLYVSTKSTEVLQQTNRQQRGWNYIGAVVHWIYPTFIRKDWAVWDQLVWWMSLVAIVGVMAGLILGLQRTLVARQRGHQGLASPFSGWLAWHHKTGLILGIVVLLWIFSGWLSMDHGRLFSVPDPSPQQIADVRNISLIDALDQVQKQDLTNFSRFREIEISALDELAVIIARRPELSELLVLGVNRSRRSEFSIDAAESAVSNAWPNNTVIDRYLVPTNDVYGNLREGSLSETTLRLVLDDDKSTWVHLDLKDGRLISVMDSSRRAYRWLFNGIHSLDFPGLANRRPLWDLVMILLMAGGFVFSLTGIVIAYRRLVKLTREKTAFSEE